MNKKILSLVLVVAMLLTSLVMVLPASAETPEELKTRGYLLSVKSDGTANGICMVFLLSDGTFMIYDGGGNLDAADAEHLYTQLQNIAAGHGLNDIVVSLWMFSHPHGDHMGFLKDWGEYASKVQVREFWYNYPGWEGGTYRDFLAAQYPDTPVKAVYAGEEYQYADVHIKVLYSADIREGATNNAANYTGTSANYTDLYGKSDNGLHADGNNASTILRMDIGDTSIMLTGDAGWTAFEDVYTKYKSDMDVDIFQVSHHGVGSASDPAIYSTANNKHMAAITPSTILVPAGIGVLNMTLSGDRAYIKNDVVQSWDNGSTATDYDGYYKLYRDFGIVDAAGGVAEGTEIPKRETGANYAQFTKEEFAAGQSGSKGNNKYYLAGQLDVDTGCKTIQEFFTSSDEGIDPPHGVNMLEGAAVRCVPDGESGLRFVSNIPAETIAAAEAMVEVGTIEDYSFGTVIFKASAVASINGAPTALSLRNAGKQYVDVPAVNGIFENKNGSVTLYAALVKLKAVNYFTDFGAVAYIEYKLSSGQTVRTYSDFDSEKNVRNIKDVAAAALADVKDTQTRVEEEDGVWYYGHKITDAADPNYGKYSAYTTAQREVLKTYANSNADTGAGYDNDDTGKDIWS